MKSRNMFIKSFRSIFDCKSNMAVYGQTDKPIYIKREECNEPNWEGEWERVQRIRKEKEWEI